MSKTKMSQRDKPEFDTEQTVEPSLKCPNCGDCFLHQRGVEVFNRNSEDDDRGQRVSVDYDDGVKIEEDVSTSAGNPSGRRDGIKVVFECELCSNSEDGPFFELVFRQRKGHELVHWNYSDE